MDLNPNSCNIVTWGSCLPSAYKSELTGLGPLLDPEMHFPDPLLGLKSLVSQLLGVFTAAGSQLSPLQDLSLAQSHLINITASSWGQLSFTWFGGRKPWPPSPTGDNWKRPSQFQSSRWSQLCPCGECTIVHLLSLPDSFPCPTGVFGEHSPADVLHASLRLSFQEGDPQIQIPPQI